MQKLKTSVTAGLVAAAAAIGGAGLVAVSATANPCAVRGTASKRACRAAAPCSAKPCGASPCSAARPCNPCNPCNPCAAGAARASKTSKSCVIPRLAKANPCAARKGCNPCAPKNPCAAKKNPCNPCAAKTPCAPCNPCNPCAAGAASEEISPDEAKAAYTCVKAEMKAAYAPSGLKAAKAYQGWASFNTAPYQSDTHGARYVNNYANAIAKAYGKFEKAGKLPKGSLLAKDSFLVNKQGQVLIGPLFLMEKMEAGFNPASFDWRYTMVMPDGSVVGTTKGQGSRNVQFCVECHNLQENQDALWFLPEEFRKK